MINKYSRPISALSKVEIIISQEYNQRPRSSSASSNNGARRPANGQQRPSGAQRPAGSRPANGQRPAGSRPAGQHPSNAQYAAQRNRKKKKRGVSPVLIILIVALVLAIAVAGGIGVYAMRYANYDKILPNVYVAGVDVGGMTVEEATKAIEESISDAEQQSVTVKLPDQDLVFTPEQDTILIDVDQAVAEAYRYGRNTDNAFAMARAIKAAERRRNDIDISTAVQVDYDHIRQLIETTAAEIVTDKEDTKVDTNLEERTITVTVGAPGKTLDADTLYTLVSEAFSTGNYSDIEFDYTLSQPTTVELDKLYEQLTTEPKDAYYDPDTEAVVEEVIGYVPTVELSEANAQLAEAEAGDVLTFAFEEAHPEMTKAELEPMLFRDNLFTYGTVYASNANRTTNLRLACAAINGTVLQPGEVFSFNEVVGERTAAKGYKEATVYINNDSEPALGGGICQVASTIYYACMYADLEIVHREAHMFRVSYVPYGLDATVYWGSVDFQFRNSTDYPLRIETYLYNGRVYVELIGTDTEHTTVDIFTKTVKADATGYIYTITRKVYDSYGNVIRTDSTADLDAMGGCGTSVHKIEGADEDDPLPSTSPSPSPSPSDEPSPSPSTSPSTAPSASPSTPVTTPPAVSPPVVTVVPTTPVESPPVVEPTAPVVDPTAPPVVDPPVVEPTAPAVVDPPVVDPPVPDAPAE